MKRTLIISTLRFFTLIIPVLAVSANLSGQNIKKDRRGRNALGHFTLWQLPSQVDNIGNSYVLKTSGGRVIVMDGGEPREADYLKQFIKDLGGVVEAWFLSHPHNDHIGAFNAIMGNRDGIKIKSVFYSRFPDQWIAGDEQAGLMNSYLDNIDRNETKVVNLTEPGMELNIDGVGFKILAVTNPEITDNNYNNSSVIIRIWDKVKSVVFLADAGVEEGDKVLAAYPDDLNCDYLQVSHHGQQGCSESFYKTIKFKTCLWPTPGWVWEPREGSRLTTRETRRWMDEIGIREHHVSCNDGLVRID